MPEVVDYREYYDDETYLFDKVGPHFCKTGIIDPADFYMMLIWKANRVKNRQRDRLKERAGGTFADAVARIASSLHAENGQKERLAILMVDWWFYLPTATAILTILYPKEFTIFDYRVANQLGFKNLAQRSYSEKLWMEYEEFREKVRTTPPQSLKLSLRDCDRFLTGQHFREELERDCNQ